MKLKSLTTAYKKESKTKIEYKYYANNCKDETPEDYLLDNYLNKISNSVINSVLDTFEPVEKELILTRFGLNGREIKTLQQLAEEENITYEGIRKRERKILTKIKRTPSLRNQLRYLLDEK